LEQRLPRQTLHETLNQPKVMLDSIIN